MMGFSLRPLLVLLSNFVMLKGNEGHCFSCSRPGNMVVAVCFRE